MRPEVQIAVDDILNGTSVDSHTEWLQREYIRLMRREARLVHDRLESKSTELSDIVRRDAQDDGNAESHRSTEQYRAEDNGASSGGNTANNN